MMIAVILLLLLPLLHLPVTKPRPQHKPHDPRVHWHEIRVVVKLAQMTQEQQDKAGGDHQHGKDHLEVPDHLLLRAAQRVARDRHGASDDAAMLVAFQMLVAPVRRTGAIGAQR